MAEDGLEVVVVGSIDVIDLEIDDSVLGPVILSETCVVIAETRTVGGTVFVADAAAGFSEAP